MQNNVLHLQDRCVKCKNEPFPVMHAANDNFIFAFEFLLQLGAERSVRIDCVDHRQNGSLVGFLPFTSLLY